MRFVITRPRPDADALAKQLQELGHKSWLSPVMKMNWNKVEPPDPADISALVITSRNALRSLEKWHDLSIYADLPLFAVGKSSAKAARKRGFSNIFEAAERARTLPALIDKHLDARKSAPLYHPGGKKLAFDIAPLLEELGFTLQRQIVYETEPVNRLAPSVAKGLADATIDGVILLSPRSARLFGALLKTSKLTDCLSSVSCLCLSQNVADAVEGLCWRQTLVAAHPDIDHLLDLIKKID